MRFPFTLKFFLDRHGAAGDFLKIEGPTQCGPLKINTCIESLAERISTSARAACIWIVDREALLLDCVHEVDGCAVEVGSTHPVSHHTNTVEVFVDIAVKLAVIKEELVAQS